MIYLLDTNICIWLLNRSRPQLLDKLAAQPPQDFGISVITSYELWYGAAKSARPERNFALLRNLHLEVLPFDEGDGRKAGEIRAHLSREGQPIGPHDTLIAGQALARGLILVTNNRREFDRVPGLTVEDWSEI